MLRILTEPVQSIAPSFVGVLKYAPTQARAPKGSSTGGQFTGDPTHARATDIEQMQVALAESAAAMAPGITPRSMGQRAAVKQQIEQNLAQRLWNHPAFEGFPHVEEWVKSKIDLWAETSGDSDVDAGVAQLAVQEEFGLTTAVTDHITNAIKNMHGTGIKLPVKEGARLRAFVRAEYEATQAWFKEHGITHVTAIRGMDDENEDLGFGYETVTMQPASSWTANVETAFAFTTDKERPKILTTRVPVSQVLSTCVTGRGCLTEQEVILMGKPQRARVFGVSGETFYTEGPDVKKILATLE